MRPGNVARLVAGPGLFTFQENLRAPPARANQAGEGLQQSRFSAPVRTRRLRGRSPPGPRTTAVRRSSGRHRSASGHRRRAACGRKDNPSPCCSGFSASSSSSRSPSGRRRSGSRSSARSTGRRSARRERSPSTRSGTSGWWAGSSRTAARGTSTMASKSEDGEIIATFLKYWGFVAARGSSSRGGDVASSEFLEALNGPRRAARSRRTARAARPASASAASSSSPSRATASSCPPPRPRPARGS